MTDRAIDFIRTQHPFSQLDADQLERVGAVLTTRIVANGHRLIRQGDEVSTCLFVIAAGSVQLVRDGVVIQVLEEGDCFGYPSILGQSPPAFHVIAQEAVTVHCIPAAVFGELLANGAFAEFFLKNLGERLSRVTGGGLEATGGELTAEVGSLNLAAPLTVAETATVAEAARAMRDRGQDVALVSGPEPGILTDNDFQTRVLAADRGPETPVAAVATRPVLTLPGDTPVHGALLFMLEHQIHHLPLTRGGEIVGIVSAMDLLRHQTRNPLYLMRRLESLDSTAELASYAGDAASMVRRLSDGGLKVGQIGRIFASLNDALVRRLLKLAERDLGPPPTPYAWLVFGSEGRMEQALLTDQDNALVYGEDSPAAADYFGRLAERVVGDLITAGFPPCPGGCMATNWCQPLAAWNETVAGWIRTPTPDNLMIVSIFFDFRAVAGDLDTASLADQVAGGARNQIFLAHLARVSLRFKPPLGLFRRIQTDAGRVDLKKRGLAPIVAAARVFGLEAGTRARPTRERLEAAMDADLLSRDLGRTLIETYRYLLQLRLQEQMAALAAGRGPGNSLRLERLTSLEHRHLKDAFGAIRELQSLVAQRYRTDQLG